jgi:hypothetical protein
VRMSPGIRDHGTRPRADHPDFARQWRWGRTPCASPGRDPLVSSRPTSGDNVGTPFGDNPAS